MRTFVLHSLTKTPERSRPPLAGEPEESSGPAPEPGAVPILAHGRGAFALHAHRPGESCPHSALRRLGPGVVPPDITGPDPSADPPGPPRRWSARAPARRRRRPQMPG